MAGERDSEAGISLVVIEVDASIAGDHAVQLGSETDHRLDLIPPNLSRSVVDSEAWAITERLQRTST